MSAVPPNRFDLIRLILAAGVFFYHAVVLTAFAPGSVLESGLAELADVSICGFFIVSGALVSGSLARSASLADYAGKRIRRLYPACAAVLLVPAAISFTLTQDGQGVLRYLAANLSFLNFLEPRLPGLFAGNRFSEVNGALWTLNALRCVARRRRSWCAALPATSIQLSTTSASTAT